MKKNILLLFVSFQFIIYFSFGQSDSLCIKLKIETADLLFSYSIDENPQILDSVMILINYGIENCDENRIFKLRKLAIYSIQQNYNDGIFFINSECDSIFNDLPYYQKILEYRFKAMQFNYLGDTLEYYNYLKLIINELKIFIDNNIDSVNDLLINSNTTSFYENYLYFPVMQYYYYLYFLKGSEEFNNELKLFVEKGYNIDLIILFNFENSNFMIYDGF